MRQVLLITVGLLLVLACKKEENAPEAVAYLKSLEYTRPGYPFDDKSFTLYWNSSGLLDSITQDAYYADDR